MLSHAIAACLAALLFGQPQPGEVNPAARDSSDAKDVRCGVFCLYVSLKALDIDVPKYAEFERSLGPVPAQGFSLGALAAAAERQGASTLGVSTTIANLTKREQKLACIAVIQKSHFVNVTDVDESSVWYVDPSETHPTISSMPHDAFRSVWDGNALLIAREPLVAEEDLPRDISWANLAGYAGLAVGALLLLYIAAWAIKKSGKGKMAI